jgi:Arc/MetJ-type ribon-helix-helix transcriptional regulator
MSNSINSKSRKDIIVSVRLPKSLVDELKDLQPVNHFMDLSDEIRFIVRRYCLSFLNSQGQQPIEGMLEQKRKEKLIQELTKIIDTLKGAQLAKEDNVSNQDG